MNEVQKALANWVKLAYQSINQKLEKEADLFGFKKAMFESGEVQLVHNFKPGKIEGCFQVVYGVKKGNHTTAILIVEFGINGFVMVGQRKTKIIKSALGLKNGHKLRRL